MNRVLVTAALGNVGREVARECAAQGLTVRVAGQRTAALQQHFPGLETVRLDFLDPTTWAQALSACELVFLLRPPPIGDMDTTLCPFVTQAYAAGVQHIVFLSVAGADRMKWVPHRKVELHLAEAGRAWTILRPGFFAQNLQDAYREDILHEDRLYVPAGQGRVAFVDVRDIAAVAARVFEHPATFRGEVLTLTGPGAVTFDEVAVLLTQALGRTIRYQPASIPGYLWHLRVRRRLSAMQAVIQTILHVGLRRGDAEKVEPTAERILGRAPRDMAAYIADAVPLWRR